MLMKNPQFILITLIILLYTYTNAKAEPSVEEKIDITFKMLQKNKSDYWKLTGEIETHIKNKVTNVADRQVLGLFKILGRHQQLNEDLAKVDEKLEQAYQKWRKENQTDQRCEKIKDAFWNPPQRETQRINLCLCAFCILRFFQT